ncbi:MAG: Hsp70 protein [Hyperionvirus sp.]|uniref:Hsp70 protein n=1 Tax=Hyperionvirus sp. TaxID=2487770 RepID=A0A3G5ADT4_9VIRU|nr:MAG: Hsp70 protein [Hyperionvirus sp.]
MSNIDTIINDFFDSKPLSDPLDNLGNINVGADLGQVSESDDEGEILVGDIDVGKIVKDDIIVGIDLGTSNSSVGVWRNNNCEIIPDEYGNNSLPSVVAFSGKSRYVGEDAKNQTELNVGGGFL